jgi:ubiquinone/menaquinone biosynthesis C-methylase UbiE
MTEHAPHPVFARIYAKVAEMSERRGGSEHRRKLLAGLSGRVVEVGAGSGANFRHYPASVGEVIAVEPERYLRERAQQAAANAPVPVHVEDGDADHLPGEAESFDAGIVALMLCTVPNQQSALAELYRVIRPGGELRFYEHVLAHSKWEARFQRLADATFWPQEVAGEMILG